MADLSQGTWTDQLLADEDAVVIDVRTDQEVSGGIIQNAKHIDIYKGREFLNEIEKLDRTKRYYVYCRAGVRSRQACHIMNQLGFEHTFNLVGGFANWRGKTSNI